MLRLRPVIDRLLAWTLIALMGLAVVNVLWQVLTRWVMATPSSFTEELARYLLIWIGLLGGAYAVGQKLHLAIELVPMRLQGQARHRIEVVIEAAVAVFALVVMVGGGLRLMQLTLGFGQTSAALGLPLGAVYAVVPLSGLLILFYTAIEITQRLRALRGDPAVITPPHRSTTDPID
jgi:TRAP-type C4-dicarboxylate transport system permease small subunit